MRPLYLGFLAVFFPALSMAGVAGDWAGVLTVPSGSTLLYLHVAGPDSALRGTLGNGPGTPATPISSIAFSGATLQFSVSVLQVNFSGDVNGSGTLVGTFNQRGAGFPVTLARVSAAPARTLAQTPAGVLQNNHYHHNLTGTEFDLPHDWSVTQAAPQDGDPAKMMVLVDPAQKVIFASVFMNTVNIPPATIPVALSRAVPRLVAMRGGETGATAPHLAKNYRIRPGSEERTLIGGQEAVRAIGEFEVNGHKTIELLTWIYAEHTTAYFFAKMAPEDVPAVQPEFEQILQSARIP